MRRIGLAGALALGSCAQEPPLSVPYLVAHLDELNGQTVRVAGYLGECAGFSCKLFIDRAGYDAEQQWLAEVRRIVRTPLTPGQKGNRIPREPPHIGLGGPSEFDRKAEPFQKSVVIVTGRVTNMCRPSGGEPGCTDRSADLEPTDIRPRKEP